ncbi:GNAT family N-acetyltransferase [Microbacterium caowuchunii]|uniref:GNAT family N-acetyltransferase n=1 Tax=Microbacterium caowuchunii TaxID=2614638 RepID=UPI00124893B2|nr:GNAT family N-acetyltransferase [Microbacterium caowuchunii]QEV99579.1 GNAT family N-acetyltransferase [Microbacterium caowuchunii]
MALPDRYELICGAPDVDAYLRLRADAGLSPKTAEQGAAAITGTWFFCHVRERTTGRVVAMGRVIGDGGWYFHIADIATHPEHQGAGLGRMVLDALIERIRAVAPPDPYITLIADPPGRRLYEKTGFVDTDPSVGMRLATSA